MDTVQPAIPNTSNTSSSSQLSPAPSTFQASSPTGQSSSANKWLIIIGISLFLILIIVIFVSVSFYLSNKRNSQYVTTNTQITNPTQPVVSNKTPYGELSLALDKTIAVKTLYMDYKTQVESRLAFAKTGLTQTLHNNVDGYITGSTDGKTGKMDFRIYSDKNPDKSVNMSVINTENGDWYVKTATTGTKWLKFTKTQHDKYSGEQPIDASLYGLNILGTIMSENQAILKAYKKDSVEKLGEESIEGVTYAKYQVEISTPDFINLLSQDKDRTEKDVSESKIILKDAIITTIYYEDKTSNYLRKLIITAKNLTQIPTLQSQQLGVTTTHDISLTTDLSRFDVPTNITPPDPGDIITQTTGT